MKNKITVFFLASIFLSFFLLLNWNSFSAPFERDEGEYAYSAWLLRSGGTPYQDSFLQKPPLIVYTYLLGQTIDPWAVWPPRVLAALFVFLTAMLVGLIAFKEWGIFVGIFSIFLFLPLIAFPPLTPFSANTEKFMILPMTALLTLFVYFKDSQKIWPYVLAGIFSVLAILYKPICLPVIFFIIIFWMFKLYRLQTFPNYKVIIKPIVIIAVTSFLSTLILLSPFFKVWSKFFQEVFTFNISYVSAFNNSFYNLINYSGKFFRYWWVLIILFGSLFIKIPKNFYFYIFLCFLCLLTIFSSPIGHYYLILMPFITLVLGSLFGSYIDNSSNKEKIWITIGTLTLILFIILLPFKKQFSMSPEELSVWVYGTVNPFGESKEVASHLAKITKIDDTVFVAGSEPQIYYYAKRKSNNRFVITYPLNLETPYREEFQKELISSLEKKHPKAIVFSQRIHSGLWNDGSPDIFIKYFDDLILKNYNVVGGYVWDNTGGHWQEPISTEEIKNSSLLLLLEKNG
ncbi:MAG: hypothetical protein WCI91_02085 [Candidatus Nomurabacteria bacterium]